jgi:transglutaminase-like putative cysteine protease
MKLNITHQTQYAFSSPVTLHPYILRFRPRQSEQQQIRSFRLDISPSPAGFAESWDAAGNDVRFAWFDGPVSGLQLLAQMEIETCRDDRPAFIIFPYESARFPIAYHEDDALALAPFLAPAAADPGLRDFANAAAHDAGNMLSPFVHLLTRRIHERIENIVRETGEPLAPLKTLTAGTGSCRDQAVLAMAALRYKGVASRFVSGYRYLDDEASHDLHAWVEVYFPGGGWRGFDPTTGLDTDERYVRVAAAAAPDSTLPVTGSYLGAAGSSLKTEIRIWRAP